MATYEQILTAAQGLSQEERTQLLAALWEEVSPEKWSLPSQDWLNEADQRSQEYESGQMEADTWENVRQRARKQAGLDD